MKKLLIDEVADLAKGEDALWQDYDRYNRLAIRLQDMDKYLNFILADLENLTVNHVLSGAKAAIKAQQLKEDIAPWIKKILAQRGAIYRECRRQRDLYFATKRS